MRRRVPNEPPLKGDDDNRRIYILTREARHPVSGIDQRIKRLNTLFPGGAPDSLPDRKSPRNAVRITFPHELGLLKIMLDTQETEFLLDAPAPVKKLDLQHLIEAILEALEVQENQSALIELAQTEVERIITDTEETA